MCTEPAARTERSTTAVEWIEGARRAWGWRISAARAKASRGCFETSNGLDVSLDAKSPATMAPAFDAKAEARCLGSSTKIRSEGPAEVTLARPVTSRSPPLWIAPSCCAMYESFIRVVPRGLKILSDCSQD